MKYGQFLSNYSNPTLISPGATHSVTSSFITLYYLADHSVLDSWMDPYLKSVVLLSSIYPIILIGFTRVASSIPVRSHSFAKIDHEIFSTVILLPSAESFKKGCCQLQAKVCARSTGLGLTACSSLPRKKCG